MTDAREIKEIVDAWADVLGFNLAFFSKSAQSDVYSSTAYTKSMAHSLNNNLRYEKNLTITWLFGAPEGDKAYLVKRFLDQEHQPSEFGFYLKAVQRTKEQFDLADLFARNLERSHVTLDNFQARRVAALFAKSLSENGIQFEDFFSNESKQWNLSVQFLTGNHLPLVDKYKFNEAVEKTAAEMINRNKPAILPAVRDEQEAASVFGQALAANTAAQHKDFFSYLAANKISINDFLWKVDRSNQREHITAHLRERGVRHYEIDRCVPSYDAAIKEAKQKIIEINAKSLDSKEAKLFQNNLPEHLKEVAAKFVVYAAMDGKTFAYLNDLYSQYRVIYASGFLEFIGKDSFFHSRHIINAIEQTAKDLGADANNPIDLHAGEKNIVSTLKEPGNTLSQESTGTSATGGNISEVVKSIHEIVKNDASVPEKVDTTPAFRLTKYFQDAWYNDNYINGIVPGLLAHLKASLKVDSDDAALVAYFAKRTDLDRWNLVKDFLLKRGHYDSSEHSSIDNALSSLKMPADRSKEIIKSAADKNKTDLKDINNMIRNGALKDLGSKYSPSRRR